MIKSDIILASQRGQAAYPIRQRAAKDQKDQEDRDKQQRLPTDVVAAQTFLESGALLAFIEEMESRGASDVIMVATDAAIGLLMQGPPDLNVLVVALQKYDGIVARIVGTAIEIHWVRESSTAVSTNGKVNVP